MDCRERQEHEMSQLIGRILRLRLEAAENLSARRDLHRLRRILYGMIQGSGTEATDLEQITTS